MSVLEKSKLADFQQSIINRLASNSMTIKGWSIVISTTIIGVSVKDKQFFFSFLALLPLFIFWGLDGYYLAAERACRKQFDRLLRAETMESGLAGNITIAAWLRALTAPFTWGVHGAIALIAIGVGLFGG